MLAMEAAAKNFEQEKDIQVKVLEKMDCGVNTPSLSNTFSQVYVTSLC